MSSPNKPFKPPTSPPPPINWATKPKQATATLTTDGRQLAILIDLEQLADLEFEQAGLCLFKRAPDHPSGPSVPVQQELKVDLDPFKEAFQGGSNGIPSHLSSHLSRSSEDLSSTLSDLSVTATPSQSKISPSKLTPTPSPTKKRKKYYVVTVGKCAGVFCDDWYVNSHLFEIFVHSKIWLLIYYRDNVKPLVDFVSGARYQSYPTRDDAVAAYRNGKINGLARIIRDPGDDEIYGPMFYAIQ